MNEDDVEELLLEKLKESEWRGYAIGLVVEDLYTREAIRRADSEELERKIRHYINEVLAHRLQIKDPELGKVIEEIQEDAIQQYELLKVEEHSK